MSYLVTGAAGFIGSQTAAALLERGETVVGLDNLNSYYTVALKKSRLAQLVDRRSQFSFHEVDIADRAALEGALAAHPGIRHIIHLAAQAGVRYSLTHPEDYVSANLTGHLNMLEHARNRDGLEHMVYASSSSVYGGNASLPFRESDRVDKPTSFYAATKLSDELMSYSYAGLYGIPLTGLRYFTVYGPWGRPDMAYWIFADAILSGRAIDLFDGGRGRRDFTYIADAVAGTLAVAARPPVGNTVPHRLYNLGKGRSNELSELVSLLEAALGRKADKRILPAQPGDVSQTEADISAIQADHAYTPTTPLQIGIPLFSQWFLNWRNATAA